MPATMNISLPNVMKTFVEDQVNTCGYGSVSEYVRELVKGDQKERAETKLEALLLEGLDSGDPRPTERGYRKDLLRDLQKRRRKKKP